MKKVIIIGAGGHGKVVADIIRKSGDEVLGFLDDGKETGSDFYGSKILGKVHEATEFNDAEFIIAIGNNSVRKMLSKMPLEYYTAIHPSAIIAEGAEIGEGSMITAGAVINSDAVVGRHTIINTCSVVEHDCLVADFAHISPGAVVCGTAKIGECVWIGAGAVVRNNVSVCNRAMIGAGAAAVKDIIETGVYVGVPAKKIK